MYSAYKSIIKIHPIVFSSISYKDRIVQGRCSNWKYFIANGLNLPFDDTIISSISIYSATESPDENSLYQDELRSNQNATCNDVSKVRDLLDGIQTGKQINISCSSSVWKVIHCESYSILCANCSNLGDECHISPATPNRMIMNPCYPKPIKVKTTGYSVIGFDVEKLDLFPIPVISSRAFINVTTNSVEFQQKFDTSSPGIVYCLPRDKNNKFISTADIVLNGQSQIIMGSEFLVTISFENLIPETFYQLYCYTKDFKGHAMDLTNVLGTIANFTTSCCRSLSFITAKSSLNKYDPKSTISLPVIFSFMLDSPVTSDCFVGLSSESSQDMGLEFLPFGNFTYLTGSSQLVRNFQIRGLLEGFYNITVFPINCMDTIHSDSFRLEVVSTVKPPDAPKLKSAIFSDNGKSL